MKTLVLIRHSYALSRYEAGVPRDELRPLSAQGREKAALTAQRLAQLPVRPVRLLTSPLRRAVETAQILSQGWKIPILQAEELNGLQSEEKVAEFLQEQVSQFSPLLAVGHNPNFSCLYSLLCGQPFVFAPGAFAVLQTDEKGNWRPVYLGE